MGQNYKHSKLRLSELQLEDSVIWEEAEPTNAALESSTLRHYCFDQDLAASEAISCPCGRLCCSI